MSSSLFNYIITTVVRYKSPSYCLIRHCSRIIALITSDVWYNCLIVWYKSLHDHWDISLPQYNCIDHDSCSIEVTTLLLDISHCRSIFVLITIVVHYKSLTCVWSISLPQYNCSDHDSWLIYVAALLFDICHCCSIVVLITTVAHYKLLPCVCYKCNCNDHDSVIVMIMAVVQYKSLPCCLT